MTYLIDTNVLSEQSRKEPDPRVVSWFAQQQALVVSAITIEELTFGLARLPEGQGGRLRRWYEQFLQIPPEVIPVDQKIARLSGRLRAIRERAGRTSTQADMLIAATAQAHDRVLVTRNVRDFEDCGVALLNPFSS